MRDNFGINTAEFSSSNSQEVVAVSRIGQNNMEATQKHFQKNLLLEF
jgi:predicted Fe-Mo cluster-binding NifX family protein